MRVFGRWRKNSNNIPVSELDGNRRYSKPAIGQKRSLFDGIVGFDDVKELFDMSIRADKASTSTPGRTTCFSQVIVYEFTY